MKFLRYISFVAAALAMFSCQEVDKTCALPADKVEAPVLDEHSDIIVDADNLSSEVTFTWSAVDYGYPAAVSYALYAVYGEAEPYQIGESHSTSYTLTKETLNNALVNSKGLAVPAETTSTVFFYIVSSIATGNDDSYAKKSEPIALQVTTIKSTSAPWIRRPLYVPGSHQGWVPDTAPVLWETGENTDVYEGLVYLVPAEAAAVDCEFKFCPNPSWDGNLGGNLTAMTNEGNPANITAAKGLYWIKVTLESDHSTGSVKLTPVTQVGVTGTAIGAWPDDKNPNPDLVLKLAGLPEDYTAEGAEALHNAAVNAQIWEGVCDDCKGGEFKFRLNADWDLGLNWGGDNLEHINFNGSNCKTNLTGKVRFKINFHGDIDALAEDATNPSPVSATVENVE